jgi:hypothetical protein
MLRLPRMSLKHVLGWGGLGSGFSRPVCDYTIQDDCYCEHSISFSLG